MNATALPHTAAMPSSPTAKPKLLDQLRAAIRAKRYEERAVQAYANWIARFILFHHKRHRQPIRMAAIRAFIYHVRQTL